MFDAARPGRHVLNAYERAYTHHISPDDVEDDWVEAMVTGHVKNARTGKSLGTKTVRARHALLHSIMNRALRVERSGTYLVAAEGKSQKSMRRIKVDAGTADVIRQRCEGKRVDELVFTLKGQMWTHHRFRQALEQVRDQSGLPKLTAHWFRHTHVAWLAMGGAPLPELQSRIGHASITTTIGVYGGMIGDVQVTTLDAFARMRDLGLAIQPKPAQQTIESTTA